MTVERRFETGAREDPSDAPGLVLGDDGIAYLVAPDGTRTPVGGGGSLPAEWTVTANGGLQIDLTDTMNPGLLLVASTGTDAEPLIKIETGSGDSYPLVDDQGSVQIAPSADASYAGLTVGPPTGGAKNAIESWDDGFNNLNWYTNAAGHEIIAANTAPADAELSPGEVTFWFDKTNGAAAFNIKGKQADGTVVTATVPLT